MFTLDDSLRLTMSQICNYFASRKSCKNMKKKFFANTPCFMCNTCITISLYYTILWISGLILTEMAHHFYQVQKYVFYESQSLQLFRKAVLKVFFSNFLTFLNFFLTFFVWDPGWFFIEMRVGLRRPTTLKSVNLIKLKKLKRWVCNSAIALFKTIFFCNNIFCSMALWYFLTKFVSSKS